MQKRSSAPRGYVLMVVVVLGIVLASLAAILIYATGRDRAEARQQQSSVRAVYAAEAAVAVGIEHLRELLEQKTAPSAADLDDVEQKTVATLGTSMSSATFPVLSVKYYNSVTNTVGDAPSASSNSLVTITEGPNKGLRAQQTPIQVLATAKVNQASASVADAIRVDLIPVFQFAIFFDGDLEAQRPARMSVSGRVHTNGNLYLSNGERVDFLNTVTVAGRVNSRGASSAALTVGSGTTGTYFRRLSDGTQVAIANNLPRASDADQKTYLETTYGIGGGLQDSTTGAEPLSIPLRLSGASPCTTDAACGAGRSCVRVRVTDPSGVCTDNVTSRPPVCSTGAQAEFAQSLAIELIRRPALDYSSSGLPCTRPADPAGCRPYAIAAPFTRDDVTRTSPYAADFGVRPALVGGPRDDTDMFELVVPRRVPIVTSSIGEDDPGAVVDRLYWKAHIRIIDGIWYRGQSPVPVFNPEVHAPGLNNPDPTTDLQHAFARVLRYAWWWDVRENRVYCESSDANSNCVTNGNEFHRGQQIRATDFDGAAFMALLDRADARSLLFPGGIVPDGGIIVYISETYDPRYEDANSRLPRTANVRNFLNFPTMHNHLTAADMTTAPASFVASLPRRDPATAFTEATPATPHQLGWFPENIWGHRVAGLRMESLTRPPATANTSALRGAHYADPRFATGVPDNGSSCANPGVEYTTPRRPPSRPTSFGVAAFDPPCLQAGAQPLGPENAVRLVRGQTLPSQGFTLVTDNRLYIHGDVNTRADSTVVSGTFQTSQDISGRMSFIADSLTIQSAAFNDRTHQSAAAGGALRHYNGFFRRPHAYAAAAWTGGAATGPRALPYSHFDGDNATATLIPLGPETVTPGEPPNICNVVATAVPTETRINASLLMGDVPACLNAGDTLGNNSGGVNNFPRFVENWTDIPLVLNGSMVGLFRSERGNSRFLSAQTIASGVIRRARTGDPYSDMGSTNMCDYRPPIRRWTFDDTLLQSIANLPPGTPRVVATDRLRWVRR
jgi:Tfp pilus assembly protein PilX